MTTVPPRSSFATSQFPKWHDCMDAFVGAHGTVFDYVSVFGDEYVRVTFSPRLSKTDWCFLEDWLVPAVPAETQDNTQDKMTTREFKLGDKAVCREKHTGCDSPNWVTDMDRIVGVVGTVVGLGSYIRVKYGNGYGVEWSFRPEWLEPALTSTQDKMTTLSSQEALITVKAVKVYAHMSDKVAYYRVNLGENTNAYFNDTPIEYVLKPPKKEEKTPEPEKPKFTKGDIVVCKTKPGAASPAWGRDVLLGVPGRVVGPCPNGVTVEFLGDRVVYDFRDEWLVHEEPDIAKTMQDLFARKK